MPVADVLVHRQVVSCVVVGPDPGGDRAVRSAVSGEWPQRLDEALAAAGPDGYWLIRRLHVQHRLSATWTSSQVASELALGTMRELARRTRTGNDPDVLWFPDRASFLAHYLVDLAGGRASGRWQYADLPRSVVRLAEQEPDELASALVGLRPVELQQVAGYVPPGESEALLRGFQGVSVPALVLPALRELRDQGRLAGSHGRASALLLAVTAAKNAPLSAVSGPALELGALLDAGAGPDLARLLAQGSWAAAARLIDPDLLLPFVQWAPTDREALAAAFATPGLGRTERVSTPYGGCFVLVQLLDDLWRWELATLTWPPLGDVPPARVARLLTTGAVLCRGESTSPLEDEVVRELLGCDAELADLVHYLAALGPEQVTGFEAVAGDRGWPTVEHELMLPAPFGRSSAADLIARAARAVVALLGRSLPGMAGASPSYLWHNVLDLDARVAFEKERVVVELGNPPLGVLLSIAGLNRGEIEGQGGVPWLLTTRS